VLLLEQPHWIHPEKLMADTSKPASVLRRLIALAVTDTTPLRRHRDFRLLFTGQLVSMFGTMITAVAVPFQAYALTHSPLAVGLFGLVQLVPLLVLAFVGGALADALDRRRMVQVTELSLALLSGLLMLNALLLHPQVWPLYVVAAMSAGLDALQRPSLDALLPRLVERSELTAASALFSLRSTSGMILGPAAAGLLIASFGLPVAYAVDMATFAVSLVALSRMRAVPPPPDATRPSFKGVAEGLRFASSSPVLLGTYLVDMVAMFFGMPNAIFPVLAVAYAGSGRADVPVATAVGLLYAAPAAGAFLASLTSGWSGRVHRHGLAVLFAAGAWGVAVTGVGLAPSLVFALVFLALAGAADMVSGVFRSTIWNTTVPDALRGRLASIEMISYSSGPLLGDVESGAVASAVGPSAAILVGGVLCVLGVAAFALLLPRFRRYDAREVVAPESGSLMETSVG
jgi:MFS family permease